MFMKLNKYIRKFHDKSKHTYIVDSININALYI